jgi:hypothetical protein
MAKQGPLGTAEKFYIEKNWNGENLEDICKSLDRSKSAVKKYVAQCKRDEPELFNVKNLMASREGIAVMTEDASSLADAGRNLRGETPRPQCVFKISGED